MSYDDALSHHFQRMLMADFGLSWEGVQPDSDGEICFLDTHDRLVSSVLLELESTTWARLWITAAAGLKRHAKLLREVNELNLSLRGARALLTEDGRLVLACEIVLSALEPGVLRQHVDILSENAERSGSMIRLMFGGVDAGRIETEVEP